MWFSWIPIHDFHTHILYFCPNFVLNWPEEHHIPYKVTGVLEILPMAVFLYLTSKFIFLRVFYGKYQPAGKEGTRLPPENTKWQLGGPKMADGVWKGVLLLLHKFFYLRSRSLRKGCDGEEKKNKKIKQLSK